MAEALKGDVVTLHMTDEEAKALTLVLGGVGGPPDGLRGQVDHITEALASIGYDTYDPTCHKGDFIFNR